MQGTPKSTIPFQRSVSNATIDTVVDDSNELLQSLIPSPINLTPPITVETYKENIQALPSTSTSIEINSMSSEKLLIIGKKYSTE